MHCKSPKHEQKWEGKLCKCMLHTHTCCGSSKVSYKFIKKSWVDNSFMTHCSTHYYSPYDCVCVICWPNSESLVSVHFQYETCQRKCWEGFHTANGPGRVSSEAFPEKFTALWIVQYLNLCFILLPTNFRVLICSWEQHTPGCMPPLAAALCSSWNDKQVSKLKKGLCTFTRVIQQCNFLNTRSIRIYWWLVFCILLQIYRPAVIHTQVYMWDCLQ